MPENTGELDQSSLSAETQTKPNQLFEDETPIKSPKSTPELAPQSKEDFKKLWEELDTLSATREKNPYQAWSENLTYRVKEIKKVFSDNAEQIIDLFTDSSDEEKEKAALALAKSCSWDKENTSSAGDIRRQERLLARYKEFVGSIPAEAITDKFIVYGIKDKKYGNYPSSVATDFTNVPDFFSDKAVEAAKLKNADDLIAFLHSFSEPGIRIELDPLLKTRICAALPKEIREAMWHEYKHHVSKIPKLLKIDRGMYSYRLLLMHDFPIKEQKAVIDEVYIHALEGTYRDEDGVRMVSENVKIVASTLSSWQKSDSFPIIQRFLSSNLSKSRINKMIFAESVKNWSTDEVVELVKDLDFLAKNHHLGGGPFQEQRNNIEIWRFKLAYLGQTQNVFNEQALDWLSAGVAQNSNEKSNLARLRGSAADFSQELIKIFAARPELIPQYINQATVLDSGLSKYMLGEVGKLPPEEQYAFMSAFANYYCWSNPDASKISRWDVSHQKELIRQMLALQRDESIDDAAISDRSEPLSKALNLLSALPFDIDRFDDELIAEAFNALYPNNYFDRPEGLNRKNLIDSIKDTPKKILKISDRWWQCGLLQIQINKNLP